MRSDIRIRIRRAVIRIRIPTRIRLIIRITTEDQSKEHTTFNILTRDKSRVRFSFYRAERRAPTYESEYDAPSFAFARRPAVAPPCASPPKSRARQPLSNAGA